MPYATLAATRLRELIVEKRCGTLLSVDGEPVFDEAHLEHSKRNAVYEMGFVDRMAEIQPSKSETVVVYSREENSHAAAFAAEKLERAGYEHVFVLEGGSAAWETAGLPWVRGTTVASPPPAPHGRLVLDPGNSRLHWTGRNLANLHEGTIGLQSGWVELDHGILRRGELEIDMHAIECSDIADTKMRKVLVAHLRDHDFFDTDRHPRARVALREVRQEPGLASGRPNIFGTADLHLRGKVNPLRFELTGGPSGEGGFSLQGPLSFDRTRWGVLYGSGQFFARLGMHLVNDFIDLDLRLNFKRED